MEKILLIHLISNGDCLYATTVARQIKNDHPGCHLTWTISSSCKSIIANNPYVDEVVVIPNVNKANCTGITRVLRSEAEAKRKAGDLDTIYFTQIIDDNQANYDGCIRSAIFRGYDKPITVPVTPVLRLLDEEVERVRLFAERCQLHRYTNIILFEFAPQSGQLSISSENALRIAAGIVKHKDTAVILSSNRKVESGNPGIVDGSELSLRETAALTHYCTLLLGCSSGITWISTSDAAKPLPMVQMLDPNAYWVNSISRDFERFGLPAENIIEIYSDFQARAEACMEEIFVNGFATARQKFYMALPLQFKTTRRSIYNMLVNFQFASIAKHIRISAEVFGWQPLLIQEIIVAFITAPFKLIYNVVMKRIVHKKTAT